MLVLVGGGCTITLPCVSINISDCIACLWLLLYLLLLSNKVYMHATVGMLAATTGPHTGN